MRGIIRRLALELPPVRRLVEQRDRLLEQVESLLEERARSEAALSEERARSEAALSGARALITEQSQKIAQLLNEIRGGSRSDLRDSETRVALLHIAKTGGTTLGHRLVEVCEPNELIGLASTEHDGFGHARRGSVEQHIRTLPDHVLKRCRIVSGHLPFGFDTGLSIKFSYVSFFRSPVERVLSGFLYGGQSYFKRDKEWLKFALHLSVSNGGAGFDNGVTRLLTGSDALVPSSPRATVWDLPRVSMADRGLVIERLKRNFGFVGLTERFEDSCEMLFGLLGKPYHRTDIRLNETELDLEISELPSGTLYLLEKRLDHDIAVYAAACERFNEFAAAHGFPPSRPYTRRLTTGAFSSGDHAHIVDAQSVFGADHDAAWLSCPIYRKKSGEFIGYDFAEPYGCRAVTIQMLPTNPARKLSFLVEASDDDFDHDIRQAYQIETKTDGHRRQIELPHNVTGRSWRLRRLSGSSARPLAISYLRFGEDDGVRRDLDAAAKRIASVKNDFSIKPSRCHIATAARYKIGGIPLVVLR